MNKKTGKQPGSKTNDLLSNTEFDFDEYYIDFYLSGNSKRNSYLKACEVINCDQPQNINQAAWQVHKRLDRDGLIQARLSSATLDDRVASRNKLNELREHSDSESIQYQVAKHQSGDLYSSESTQQGITVNVNRDNVSITRKN